MFPPPVKKSFLQRYLKPVGEAIVGSMTVLLLRVTRYFDPVKTANFFGWVARKVGPLMKEDRIGRDNLTKAFPEKSPDEIQRILTGVWDNLGRMGAEFAHLDRVWDHDPAFPERSRIEIPPRTHELFAKMKNDGKPALVFAGHLGNWEMPALAAVTYGLDATILYRPPNIVTVRRAIEQSRSVNMGQMIAASPAAPTQLVQALENGRHVAILVDQYFARGVDVTFFGRTTRANPTLARLLRQIECPVYGVRIVRLPGDRFRAELSEEVIPPRDAEGRIDIQGTMQAITNVVEDWVREYPDQWLWLHRRWR